MTASQPNRQSLPVIKLAARSTGPQVTAQAVLRVQGESLALEVSMPQGKAPSRDLLPIFQGLTHAFIDRAVGKIEEAGKQVSCQAGCGACCQQLVPITETEAHVLADYVKALPEPEQTEVRERFRNALAIFEKRGVLGPLTQAYLHGGGSAKEIGLDYFRQGVDCPFLVNQMCSIHAIRPLACREYLVTSPAEHCKAPEANTIEMVPLPGRVSLAVMHSQREHTAQGWVPLVLALDWSERMPEKAPAPAPEMVRQVIEKLCR